ncbi:sugar transporter [Bradyrhizobium sp. STM 3809]|uniref:sugar transporter n=1 Tax=Bradyrhizobium sp. STM 3809 TaxID=551936 RepID=UPI0002409D0D|nr:sugar transporter [Bradyrhizobium sp. STM 3809]CCE01586.1 conserved membrane hypothetical protein [Bradyrhizobium sp. STM 3809]
MLQKVNYEDDAETGDDRQSNLLRPAFYWEIFKRRSLYLLLPLIVIVSAGAGVAWIWPPTYLSEGKILVQSQLIPTELVRPTVTSAAQERIQVIEQRLMTRDNLIAIVDKFQLFQAQRNLMSPTQLVDLMKAKTSINIINQSLSFSRRTENPTIVFTVGYEDSNPSLAASVANELVTRILNEDIRDRTSRASDTTKFLGREVERLQAESAALEAKIAQAKESQVVTSAGATDPVAQMKAEYAQKSAIYSDKHPLMKALKRQIEAAEKAAAPAISNGGTLDALQSQREAIQKNLENASAKFATAQLGEALEKNQQSEKFEVLEQPAVPQEPIRPNRRKILGLSLLLGLGVGGGLTLLLEMLDKTIRRTADVYDLFDSHFVVALPYIVTRNEERRGRLRTRALIAAGGGLVVVIAVLAFVLLPWDLIIAKARVGLFR